MITGSEYPHLTVDEDGTPRIRGTRYKVQHLAAEHFHHGWTAEELLRQHPDLRPEHVYSALTYFYDHYGPMVAQLKDSFSAHEAERKAPPFSRSELLARKTGRGS